MPKYQNVLQLTPEGVPKYHNCPQLTPEIVHKYENCPQLMPEHLLEVTKEISVIYHYQHSGINYGRRTTF